jgi:hypothetical protein
MKALLALPLVLAVPVSAQAQWKPYPRVLQFRADGDGAWTVSCQLLDKNGKPVAFELDDRGKDRFNREVTGGQCSYRAAPDETLRIIIAGDYACPLPAPEEDSCAQTFAAGSTGQLEIRRRGHAS